MGSYRSCGGPRIGSIIADATYMLTSKAFIRWPAIDPLRPVESSDSRRLYGCQPDGRPDHGVGVVPRKTFVNNPEARRSRERACSNAPARSR